MKKLSDVLEVQETLVNNYVEMKEIMAYLESKSASKKTGCNGLVEPTVLHTTRKSAWVLPRIYPGTSKILVLARKRCPEIKTLSQSLNYTKHETEARLPHTVKSIRDGACAPNADQDHIPSVDSSLIRVTLPTQGVEPAQEAAGAIEPVDSVEQFAGPRTQPEDHAEEDAAARTQQLWLRKLVTIQDSALVLHKDFRAAR